MFRVKVENLNQLEVALRHKNASEIILSRDSFSESDLSKLVNRIKKSNKLAFILLERISRYEENMNICGNKSGGNNCSGEALSLRKSTDNIFEIKNLDGIIIQNLDSFAYMLRKINKSANERLNVELNYTMNCYNLETKELYENLYNEKRNNAKEVPLLFTAPLELNIYEAAEVYYDTFLVYSYIDTMVSANCLRKNTLVSNNINGDEKGKIVAKMLKSSKTDDSESLCKSKFCFDNVKNYSSYIIDRKGKKLHYKTYCKYCYNKIFNTEPLFLLDKIDEVITLYKKNICNSDIYNNSHEVTNDSESNVLNKRLLEPKLRIDFSFENENEIKEILDMKCPKSFTRGHYKNSIK